METFKPISDVRSTLHLKLVSYLVKLVSYLVICPKALSQITITTDFHLRLLPNECHCPQFKLIGPLTLASYGECNFISFLIYSKAHRCFGKELKLISGIRIGSSRAYLSRSRTINNRTNKPK